MKETIKVKGYVKYILKDKDGNIKYTYEDHNLITKVGLSVMASLLSADNPAGKTGVGYIALGVGSGQTADSTTLANEITTNGGARQTCSATITTTNVANDTVQFSTTFNFTGSLAITEAGLFNAATAGDMIAYQDFSVINVNSGDNLQIVWNVVFA